MIRVTARPTPAQNPSSYRSYLADGASRVAAAVKRPFQDLYLIAQVFRVEAHVIGIFYALRHICSTARTIRCAEQFFTQGSDIFSNVGILQTIRHVPQSQRSDVIQHARPLFSRNDNSNWSKALIIEAISNVPQDRRSDVIQYAQRLFSIHPDRIPDGMEKARFIAEVGEVSPEKREEAIRYARPLFGNGFDERAKWPIIREIARIPREEKEDVIRHAQPLCDERMNGWDRACVIVAITEIRLEERPNVIEQAQHLFTERMNGGDKARILRDVALIAQENRAAYVQERLAGVHVDNRVAAQHGVNVHEGKRDKDSEAALKKLWEHQGHVSKTQIAQAVKDFITYIDTFLTDAQRTKMVLHALSGEHSKEDHGPLIKNRPFKLFEDLISGEELIGRLWIFASKIEDQKEQANAKVGMIAALEKSYETGFDGKKVRVCDSGKAQRLIVSVLQGRLSGVNVDIPKITAKEAIEIFFNEERRKIANRTDLLEEAEKFCNENPGVQTIKEAFLKEIQTYAEIAGMDLERSEASV